MEPPKPISSAPAEWIEISDKEAKQFYRVAPEIVRAMVLAEQIQFTVFAKKKNKIRALNDGGKSLDRGMLLKIANSPTPANPEDEIQILIRRADTQAYRTCLKNMFKAVSTVLQEEIELIERHEAPVATQINYAGKDLQVTHVEELVGQGTAIGKRAPDFSLHDHNDKLISASQLWAKGPLMLVFYPGDFSPVCTKQLCSYSDQLPDFGGLGLTILGISDNSVAAHKSFVDKYKFTFSLLSDPNKRVAKLFDTTSLMMFGAVSRAVFVISRGGLVLYRYVEPTILTHRKPAELVAIVRDLAAANLLDHTKKKVA